MICRARMCQAEAVPGFDLCDPHLEAEEEGQPVERKPLRPKLGPRPCTAAPGVRYFSVQDQRAIAQDAIRAVMAARPPRKPRKNARRPDHA